MTKTIDLTAPMIDGFTKARKVAGKWVIND